MIRAIIGLGISEFDAQVYFFLALNDSQTAKQIAAMMKQSRQQIYRSLRHLEENGVVVASEKVPAQFSVASFDKVLNVFTSA